MLHLTRAVLRITMQYGTPGEVNVAHLHNCSIMGLSGIRFGRTTVKLPHQAGRLAASSIFHVTVNSPLWLMIFCHVWAPECNRVLNIGQRWTHQPLKWPSFPGPIKPRAVSW
ncbi:hypothetical protein DPEC_G00110970 [Dallia pectoralis]|uniref:Uncharacterized protein n=1 Tax=Dallia pectoralis TaxID=75939 RepID=A0ACC2GTL6_DALPE|nr:hypothetical protein DPEC_G00110970 [Dallia pectoralis]